ncbi:MAG TPA: site-specific integrase, partial [Streptosporangiaceae bacterium]
YRVRPWLVLAGWAGLRAKEIAYLQRENVLDTAPMPHILIVSTATKGRDERCVPLNEYVIEALYEHGLPNTGYCFRRRDGQIGPNFPWTVSEVANTHLRACGIPATLHQLRHRALTQLYAETLDILLVQKIAGHHDPATTAGYAAISDTKAAEAMSRLRTPPRMRAVASAQ